jgi:hypothetical protein
MAISMIVSKLSRSSRHVDPGKLSAETFKFLTPVSVWRYVSSLMIKDKFFVEPLPNLLQLPFVTILLHDMQKHLWHHLQHVVQDVGDVEHGTGHVHEGLAASASLAEVLLLQLLAFGLAHAVRRWRLTGRSDGGSTTCHAT